MTYIKVKVPDGTDISGYEAEWRIANSGETIVTWTGTIVEFGGANDGIGRIVLTPKWKPPEWLKPGWIAKDENGWKWFSGKPAWSSAHRWWYQMKDAERSMDLSLTNFQGPDVEPKDSLIEIKG